MIKILFVCHGNICRSPMAEMVMKEMIRKNGLADRIHVDSAATSTEEIGNGVHYGTRKKLAEVGIPCEDHRAVQVRKSDYDKYDLLIVMDGNNVRNLKRIIGEDSKDKVHMLLEYAGEPGIAIADPWYTGNFDDTYRDVVRGCEGLLKHLNLT